MSTNESLTVRKIPFYLFLILLGFLIFYVFDIVTNRKNYNKDTIPPIATQAGPIPEKTAKEYMSNYLSSQDSIGNAYKLATKDGATLRGFWISKAMLKSIDSVIRQSDKTASVVGYSIYFGKETPYSTNKQQTINLVIRGTIPTKKESATQQKSAMMAAATEEEFTDAGDYYDMVDPCPKRCGDDEPN